MAYTLAQLESIEAAIASGTLRVEIDNRIVVYQKMSDLIALRNMIASELGIATVSTARGRAWVPTTKTGL
ncbi:MAG: hypothetical protein RL661_915 [Pseudomonadota bacterium]|jgi:hypothetical protein